MEYVKPPPPWEAGRQGILNALEAQMPEHTLRHPVPVVVRIEWAKDGVEQLETEALGWTDRRVYVRLPDSRWRFTSAWLRAEDVRRR
ncbi:MAG TPA: hypothetical protein VFH23_06805 [Jiangellaceae bacterium]|nr:hypothetical protein [Jiangellaceae bacterium]